MAIRPIREFKQSPMAQGVDESIAYVLDTGPWGGSPTVTSAVILEILTGGGFLDVTATKMSGSTAVSGDDITLPTISSLTENKRYRVEVKFTIVTDVLEAFGTIDTER